MSSSSIAVERPQRLLLIAVLLALLAVMQSALQAEAYAYRFIGVTATTVVRPSSYCKKQLSGFPPNLYTSVRNDAMASWMSLGSMSDQLYSDTSGTSAGQGCYSNKKCSWTWRGGPFADNRMTFYIGNSYTVTQAPSNNFYYNWETGYPTWFRYTNVIPAAVGYYAPTKQWRNSYYASQNLIFVCEVIADESENLSGSMHHTDGANAVTAKGSSKMKWWQYVLIVIAIAVALAVIISVTCWVCRKKKEEEDEEIESQLYSMPETSDDSDDDDDMDGQGNGNVVGGGKDYYGAMPVVAASSAGTDSSAAASYTPAPMSNSQWAKAEAAVMGAPAPPDPITPPAAARTLPTLANLPPSAALGGAAATDTSSNSSHGSSARDRWARHAVHDA